LSQLSPRLVVWVGIGLAVILLIWAAMDAVAPALSWKMHVSRRDRRLADDQRVVASGSLFPAAHQARAELDRFDSAGHLFDMKFSDALTGKSFDIDQVRGHVVLIDFWATWCEPCMAKIPLLREIQRKYGPKGLVVVGVSLDDSKEKMIEVARRENMTWPELFDGKGWSSPFSSSHGIYEIPTAFLVDRNGKLSDVDLNLDAAGDEIEGLLNAR
jgi:thiol-disulfide isomerase/thioredoxin